MRSSKVLRLMAIGLALAVSACGAMEAQRASEMTRQQEVVHRMDVAHVWVTTEGPPAGKPYQKLGRKGDRL